MTLKGMTRDRPFLFIFAVVGLLMPLGQTAAESSLHDWTMLALPRGTIIQYPTDVFAQDAGESPHQGRLLTTRDGRARLDVFTASNARGETPAQFLRRAFPGDRNRLAYNRVARNFFAVSESSGGFILYRRCNFTHDRIIHCVNLRYPASEKRAWDAIVTRVSLSLRPR
jgi:hypothetical protein